MNLKHCLEWTETAQRLAFYVDDSAEDALGWRTRFETRKRRSDVLGLHNITGTMSVLYCTGASRNQSDDLRRWKGANNKLWR